MKTRNEKQISNRKHTFTSLILFYSIMYDRLVGVGMRKKYQFFRFSLVFHLLTLTYNDFPYLTSTLKNQSVPTLH